MRRGLIAAGAAVVLLCGACADEGGQESVDHQVSDSGAAGVRHDAGLSEKFRDLSGSGGTARLADLTDFAWERVHVFSEGASAEQVERVVGEPVLGGKYYYDVGNLLVFEQDGKVAKAVSVVPDVLVTGGRSTWGAGTVLKPQSRTRPALLKLSAAAGEA